MADTMLTDEAAKKGLKRKREKQKFEVLTLDEKESRLKNLNEELESLFTYFNEVLSTDSGLGSHFGTISSSSNVNGMIALLLEEKSGSYSKLVGEIYERVKERDTCVTIANVKSSVLYVGQRVAYGVPNADVDVLEDESMSCLWCWETRDMKLLPKSVRGALKVRRICRKKINERITAILDVISTLQKPDDHPTDKHDVMKAADKLSKTLAERDIRLLVESLAQKNDSEMAEKEAKQKGTALIKELEKNKREAEREKKRMDRELQKEKEKERKRLQQEAEKDEKRREKEEAEVKKQLKRKQEETEREQRRREKEEAELKKQLSVQKQASIMERFLKRSKPTVTSQNDQTPSAATSDSNLNKSGNVLESVSFLMDSALQQKDEIDVKEIRKSHMNSWRHLGHSIRSNGKQHWGMRRKPKTQLIKELKLTTNKGPAGDDDLCIDSLVDGWGQARTDDKSCQANMSVSSPATNKCSRRKQLLQFDKSYRPAFYGIWPKKSCVIGPRHPLKKDPDLDYDIDSDEEWEEEDPGESLSDSEKDEEENLDEGSLKAEDDEESEDGFFVPDGYLSENEGVETDRNQSSLEAEVKHAKPSCKPEAESGEHTGWIRQQKYLHNLTENALRKNQPLIIINLMHEKAQLLSSEDLVGSSKVEQMCLQALSMRAFPGGMPIEVPADNNMQEENKEACTPNSRGSAVASAVTVTIPDSDLPKIVSAIQSCSQGMSRVLESLQQTFPDIPKSQLRNKVREISDFVDNRWKVKKEILQKLGMSSSPEKSGGRTKSIATFFSKRCLPPAGHVANPCETSPESLKPGSSSHHQQPPQQQECTENM